MAVLTPQELRKEWMKLGAAVFVFFCVFVALPYYLTFANASPIEDDAMLPLPSSLILEFDSGSSCNGRFEEVSVCSRTFVVTGIDGRRRPAFDAVVEHLRDIDKTDWEWRMLDTSAHGESGSSRVVVNEAGPSWRRSMQSIRNTVSSAMARDDLRPAPSTGLTSRDWQRKKDGLEARFGVSRAEIDRFWDSAVLITFTNRFQRLGDESYY